ncbi:MAG: serine--tRNA ligase, partial [Candidatus Gracilibacteria bacterium]|nr:serine--tRNA ligase [Candidatus Gracilibacteria bacterium]
MIDLKIVRQNPESYKDNIKKRNLKIDLDVFLQMDKKLIELNQKLDEIRATKNSFSKLIPTLSPENRNSKLAEMKAMGEEEKALSEEIKVLEIKYNNIYFRLPNFLDDTTAIGPDDSGNVVEKKFKEPTKFDFEPKTHYEIGESKGWIDTEKGSDISGARFWYLKGDLVFLQFAIVSYALSKLQTKGFLPVLPPVLVRYDAMFGTGYLPAGEDGTYRVNPDDDDLYLVGTAEVPITSYHSGEIIENLDNPIKYAGYSSCFR